MELKFVGKSAWKIDNFNSTNLNFGLLNVQKKSILLNIKIKLSFQKGCAEHYLTFEIINEKLLLHLMIQVHPSQNLYHQIVKYWKLKILLFLIAKWILFLP